MLNNQTRLLPRRSFLQGTSMIALSLGLGSSVGGLGDLLLSGSSGASAQSALRPDQRDPTVADDGTQGNIVGRQWLNTTTGRIWQATDLTPGAAAWSDQGIPSQYPGDAGNFAAIFGTKPLTSAYASGIKPFVDVYAYDMNLTQTGPITINFIGGVIDTATIRSLLAPNPATAGMPEDAMCTLRLLLVSKWYDQSGNNLHFYQPNAVFMPTLWLIDGTADGTGEDSVRIAFSRNSPLPGFRQCDRHLVFPWGGSLNTQSTTVYAVCQPHEATNDNSSPCLFGTSLDVDGIEIRTPTISVWWTTANWSYWQLANSAANIDISATPFCTSPVVLSVALGANGVEFATNDDIANLPALPNVFGTGAIIGASYKSWNFGDPLNASAPNNLTNAGFYGVIDAIMVRVVADDPATTTSVRRSLHRAFNVVPQAANDTVVIEGDSGTVSWGGVFPLIPYRDVGGNFHLFEAGIDGYGLNWMNQRKLSRLVRYVQLGHPGSGWLDPADWDVIGNFNTRLPYIKVQYSPTAKRNICVAGSHGVGVNDQDPTSAQTTFNFMVDWLNGLRAGGQNWTVVVALLWGGQPGGGFEAFNNLVISNAAAMNISYFTELTAAQLSAIGLAPNKLVNLYEWNEVNSQYDGHATPLGYAIESQAWAAAINAVL
jgi:hypothetical protein